MKGKRIIAVLIVVTAIVCILWPDIEAVLRKQESERQVKQFVASIQIGESRSSVEAGIKSYPRLRLTKVDAMTLLAETPLILGARNWVVWLTFDEQRLSRVAVRTADSANEIPAAAPADKSGS